MTVENEFLLEIVKQHGKQAWIGGCPPFEMDIIDLESCTNFRLSPNFHHQYDVVWLYEKRLDEYHPLSWKIILDEAIRLLKENGILIVHIHQNRYMSVPLLKSFLGRHINLDVDVDYEKNDSIFVFKIKRLNFSKYSSNLWSFAMLTGGKKDDVVLKFLKSIRDNDPENKHEIIISGPQKEIYDNYHVRYLDLSSFRDTEYAEISKKKNAIAEMASNPNLLIVHDRYYLADDFFNTFENYGYDWDFLAIKQAFENGDEFPFYCALYEPVLSWTHPINFTTYNHLFETQYVNGGCMIFKTHILKQLRFNPLLFWNQMEDVEITQEFLKHSIVPRVNFISKVIVVDDHSQRTESFSLFDCYDGSKIKNGVGNAVRSSLPHVCTKPEKQKRKISVNVSFRKKFPFIRISVKIKKAENQIKPIQLIQKKIKILYDVSVLGCGFCHEEARTGVYRVCQETLKTLNSWSDAIIFPYASMKNDGECLNYLNAEYPQLTANFVRLKKRRFFSKIRRIFSRKYDYCLSPYFDFPSEFRRNLFLKRIVILYDLIQVKFPQWVRPVDVDVYTRFLKNFKNDTTTLCISECTKKDFLEFKPKVKNISVIPLGRDERYNPESNPEKQKEILKKYGIPTKKYFFSISSMNPRKNFYQTVKGFIGFIEKYKINDVSLVLSGPTGWGDLFKDIDMEKYKDRIILTGFAAEEDLPFLYKGAVASVYLSLYEGFGLPPLESLACGTPVIASNTSSIPEIVSDAGLLIDPYDTDALVEAFYRLLTDEECRKTLLKNSEKVLHKYTWDNFSAALLKEFK